MDDFIWCPLCTRNDADISRIPRLSSLFTMWKHRCDRWKYLFCLIDSVHCRVHVHVHSYTRITRTARSCQFGRVCEWSLIGAADWFVLFISLHTIRCVQVNKLWLLLHFNYTANDRIKSQTARNSIDWQTQLLLNWLADLNLVVKIDWLWMNVLTRYRNICITRTGNIAHHTSAKRLLSQRCQPTIT